VDDDNPPLSFFLPLENKSEWFLRALFLCCCCCLRTETFSEKLKKFTKKNKKEEKHFLKHILRSNFLQYCCNESNN